MEFWSTLVLNENAQLLNLFITIIQLLGPSLATPPTGSQLRLQLA